MWKLFLTVLKALLKALYLLFHDNNKNNKFNYG